MFIQQSHPGMQEEQDTCRICSAPAEPDAPLFHPCKCSGTIRYIHQDCLTTWLAHSKKKFCDVCKHQYSFTKVYSPNMPKQLPFILFLRRFAHQLFWTIITCLRAIMVAIIWLAFLPYVTVWTWRFYFIVGENIAWWINDRPRPTPSPVFHPYYANVTDADDLNKTSSSNVTIMTLATSYPVWRALSSDIFTGQIIASLIVLAFLGVFLLREWIMQNARPGVFEDDELMQEPGIGAAEAPIAEAEAAEQPQADQAAEVRIDLVNEEIPEQENIALGEHDIESNHADGDAPIDRLRNSTETLNSFEEIQFRDSSTDDRPRRRRKTHRSHESLRSPRGSRYQRRPTSLENPRGRTRTAGRTYRRQMSPRSRSPTVASFDDNHGEGPSNGFQFTFAVDRSPSPSQKSMEVSDELNNSLSFTFSPSPSTEHLFAYSKSELPYPLTPSLGSEDDSSQEPSTSVRRPPMPNATLSPSGEVEMVGDFFDNAGSPSSSSGIIPDSQVLPSPGLTSYHAPEELNSEAGPSNEAAYFDITASTESPKPDDPGNVPQVDFREYFRELEADSDEEWEEGADLAEDEMDGEGDNDHHGHRPPELAAPNEAVQQNAPPEQGPLNQGQNEEQEGNADEDMDGALEEAIGMRGPITTVFQNAALMIFVLDTTIGVGIWLPFTIGKTSALLSLEPLRALQLLHWPVKTIRLVTDPLVDFCFFVLRHVFYPLFRPFIQRTTDTLFYFLPMLVQYSKPEVRQQAQDYISSTVNAVLDVANSQSEAFSSIFSGEQQDDSALASKLDKLFELPIMSSLEPFFVRLGKFVRINSAAAKIAWVELANGDSTMNRLFAIVLGYAVVGVFVALYLNILNVGSVQNAGRAIRSAIRQQLIVTKVAIFILIELVIFPFGCGLMLDLCSLPLFPNITWAVRLAFFRYAPITATFYHWLCGTMFMYQFAILLAGCRDIMRPGAMWFIKDPSDQNFHPIRDILDRPTLSQLRKLAVSAVMYSVVVACGVGSILFCCRFWGKSLLPLRWNARGPLFSLPLDLLFFHIVMPATLKYFRYRRAIRAIAARYWKLAARQLRLTSYMFGDRHPEEEYSSNKTWKTFISVLFGGKDINTEDASEKPTAPFDGSFRRVPASDHTALPREVRATIAVNEDGSPVDDAGQRLINLQNAEADKAKRDVKEDYCVVYLPPYFRYRILLFIAILWIVFSISLVSSVAIPIHLGRLVFKTLAGKEVHDGYSFVTGFYLLWACFVIGKTLDRMDKRRQRSGGDDPRGEWAVYVFKRSMLWSGKLVWCIFWLGIVIPTLIALVMEVYLIHPLRLIINPDLTLRIRIVESWILGLIYAKIGISSMRFRPETRIDAAVKRVKRAGWRRVNVIEVTMDIIIPLTVGLLGMLILPILLILGLQRLLPSGVHDKSLFIYVYPGIFVLAAITRALKVVRKLGKVWAQAIRDSEFLVEMQLQNLEQPQPKPEKIEPQSQSPSPSQPDTSADIEAQVPDELASVSSQATSNVTT